jgi:hypothetical protein
VALVAEALLVDSRGRAIIDLVSAEREPTVIGNIILRLTGHFAHGCKPAVSQWELR